MYLSGRHEYTINLKDHAAPPGFASFLEKMNDPHESEFIHFLSNFFQNFVLEKNKFRLCE